MPLTISHFLYSPVGFPTMQQHFYCRVFHTLTFPCSQLDQVARAELLRQQCEQRTGSKGFIYEFSKKYARR